MAWSGAGFAGQNSTSRKEAAMAKGDIVEDTQARAALAARKEDSHAG